MKTPKQTTSNQEQDGLTLLSCKKLTLRDLMKKSAIALFTLFSCGSPIESVPPFIEVVLNDPDGFTSPAVDSLQVTTSSILNGNPITDTFDVPLGGNTLPTDFVIRF